MFFSRIGCPATAPTAYERLTIVGQSPRDRNPIKNLADQQVSLDGIVKLSERRAEEGDFLRDELGSSARLGDLAPSRKGSLARSAAEVGRGGSGIRDVEEVRDLILNRQKPLCLLGRFKSLHDPFASPCRLVRVFRAIVQALVLAMLDAKAHLCPRSAVGTELVCDHDARRCDAGSQELSYEPLRSAAVSSTLDQDVENEAILIDRAP